MRYRITLAYQGTAYSGWQVQPGQRTIQTLLEEAASRFLQRQTRITGAGRTDAGVHALGQVAHFDTPMPIDTYRFHHSMNGLLPPDIRLLAIEEVPSTFHARYSALSKHYHYHIQLTPILSPFKRNYSLHIRQPLDLERLKKAAHLFIGTHNFTSFANEPALLVRRNPIRTIDKLNVIDEDGGIRLEFQGKSFLYKMVRNITGTLLAVANHKLSLDQVRGLFDAKDRRVAPPPAAAHGLFLVRIDYD